MDIDQTNIKFCDRGYINQFGNLTKENVMEYFMLSEFFDKKSINKQCIDLKKDFYKTREKQTGVEFNLEHVSPDNKLFIISKSFRDHTSLTKLCYYYVYNDEICQAPNLYSVLSSNVQSVSTNLLNAIKYLNDDNEDVF